MQDLPQLPYNDARSKPWKFDGYKDYSKWMASDNDFFIFRRFDSLNARTILYLQHRISLFEKDLDDLHTAMEGPDEHGKPAKMNSSFGWDEKYMTTRAAIMNELTGLLLHYSGYRPPSQPCRATDSIQTDQYIDAFSKIRARPRAEERQITNVKNKLNRKAITGNERDFINHKGDLISISSRSRPPLGRWLEARQSLRFMKVFRAKHGDDVHIESSSTVYTSDATFENFTTFGIIFTGLVMLLVPIWWLEYVRAQKVRLGIITGFICVFMFAMATATNNQPFSVVAATAAYAAVLMVFMQID